MCSKLIFNTSQFLHKKDEVEKWTITGRSTDSRSVKRGRKPGPPAYNMQAYQQHPDISHQELLQHLDQLKSTVMLDHTEKVTAQEDIR